MAIKLKVVSPFKSNYRIALKQIMRFSFQLYYWPILTAVWFFLTLSISYSVAVINKHVYPIFPYISDTGTKIPDSCIFGQLLNIGALLMGITMYVRYKQVDLVIELDYVELNYKWNKAAKYLGFITCLGISIVANFDEKSVPIMHIFGALLGFGFGSVYFIIQTLITNAFRKTRSFSDVHYVGNFIFCSRLVLGVTILPLFFSSVIFTVLSLREFDGKTLLWWTEKHKGYKLHLVAVASEWIVAISMVTYCLTFINEFKRVAFQELTCIEK